MINNRRYLIIAFLVSCIVHLLLLLNANNISVNLQKSSAGKIDTTRPTDLVVDMLDPQTLQKITEEQNKAPKNVVQDFQQKVSQQKATELIENNEKALKPQVDISDTNLPINNKLSDDFLVPQAPLAEILTVDSDNVHNEVLVSDRKLITTDIPSFAEISDQIPGAGEKRLQMIELPNIEEDTILDSSEPPPIQFPKIDLPTPENLVTPSKNESFDDMVTVKMEIYPDKEGGFFRLEIQPTLQIDQLREIAKDVIFLVDCSGSIPMSKFKQFKEGVLRSIDYLNPQDRVNIVMFAEKPQALFPKCVSPTEQNKALIRQYISRVRYGGMTDVFQSLAPFVKSGGANDRPLLIFMLTDGVTTVSKKYTTDQFVREIVGLNKSNVAIYSFSAGKGVDLTLINFLAYHNRGLAIHEEKEDNFANKLSSFIQQNTDLVLADLQLTTLENYFSQNIYPKRLPQLFRKNSRFVWGRYRSTDKEVVVSITGRDVTGKTLDLIFRKDFATAPKGDDSIRDLWALQKLFHLRGQIIIDEQNKALYEKEIQKTMREFGIKEIPF